MDLREIEFFGKKGISLVEVIAKGGYGIIYKVYSKQYKTDFALKKIPEKMFFDVEIECLMTIDDPNIVRLYQYFKYEDYIYMLMEFCPNDLDRLLKYRKHVDDDELQKYIHDMLLAVKACHDRNYAHSDIKPANFLLDKYGRVKIGDFGLSAKCDKNESCHCLKGTTLFMAPEIFTQEDYNPMKADIWALGVTLYFLATRQYPFISQDLTELKMRIESGKYRDDIIHNIHLRELIASCITVDANKRPNIDELLNYQYFHDNYNYNNSKLPKLHFGAKKPQISERKSCMCFPSNFTLKSTRIPLRSISKINLH